MVNITNYLEDLLMSSLLEKTVCVLGARSNIHGENDEHFLHPCEIENISCANYYPYPCDKVVDSYQFVNHDTALSNYFTICYHNCASLNLVRAYNGIRYACAGRSGNRAVFVTI